MRDRYAQPVLGPEGAGHRARMGRLVEGRLVEPDAEGPQRGRAGPRCERGDGARVDAAAQEHAEGHIADDVLRDGFGGYGPGLAIAAFGTLAAALSLALGGRLAPR